MPGSNLPYNISGEFVRERRAVPGGERKVIRAEQSRSVAFVLIGCVFDRISGLLDILPDA